MKAGILTFQQAINYGAVLQLYALQKVVQDLRVDAEVINYISPKLAGNYKLIKFNGGFKSLLISIFTAKAFCKRKSKFKAFEEKYLCLTNPLHTKKELTNISRQYDYVITGSDQVWNYRITNTDYTYMLDFVEDDNKKISYAASFGVAQLPESLKGSYKDLLQNFKAISVREQQGQKLVKELCGRDAAVTLDPTLMLDKHEWAKLKTNAKRKNKYILVYCLRRSDMLFGMAQKLKEKTGLELVVLNPRAKYTYTSSSAATAGPEEFVELFMDAEYVFTNSFHGTVFSINFNKKFLVDLDVDSTVNTNSRLVNILSLLGLKERIVSKPDLEKMHHEIDYAKVNSILDIERKKSINFLKMSLGINE